jgi:membrane protease YdiL (CAAX protease family)
MLPASLLCLSTLALLALTGRLSFLVNEFPGRDRRLIAALLLVAALLVVVFLPTASGGEPDIDTDDLWFPSLFLGHAVLTVFLLAWWHLRPSPEGLRRFLLLDRVRIEDVKEGLWIGALGWILTILATAGFSVLIRDTSVLPLPSEIPEVMIWLATLPLHHKLLVIAVAMTVEEGFFRAFLQTRIGWIPSSVLFALGHAGYGLPMMLFSVFVVSLVFGWSLRRNGRLLPCIVAHGAFDAIQLLVIMPAALRYLGET